MADNQIDRIGLGVDLVGGSEVLTDLRALREEMTAIANLATRGKPNNSSGSKDSIKDLEKYQLNSIAIVEKAQIDSIKRIAKVKAESAIPITGDEIGAYAAQGQRRQRLASEIKLKNEQEQRDFAQYVSERRKRIQALQSLPDIEERNFNSERKAFRRYRNDPARDEQTDIFRRQLSEEVQAQRNSGRETRRVALERYGGFPARGQRLAESARQDAIEREQEREAQREEDRQAREREVAARARQRFVGPHQLSPAEYQGRINDIERSNRSRSKFGGSIADELGTNTSQDKAEREAKKADDKARRDAQFQQAKDDGEKRRIQNLIDRAKQRRADKKQVDEALNDPNDPDGPGPKGGGGKGGGQSFFDKIGTVAKGFLIYQTISRITKALEEYAVYALAAAKATVEQGNALKFATESAGGNLNANRALAESLGAVGYNRAEGAQTVAAATRAAFRNPAQASGLSTLAVDIAAYRGGGNKESPQIIEDILGGRDRKYREYFNVTPEDIYKQAAKKQLGNSPSVTGGRLGTSFNYDTEQQLISKYVSALSEEEKEQLRLNYALSQAFRFEGDAATRAGTLAGKIDLVSSSFFNAAANVGTFITELRPVREALDGIIAAKVGDIFKPPVLKQSGQQSTISDADREAYANEVANGSRAGSLRLASNITGTIADNITPINSLVNFIRDRINPRGTDAQSAEYDRNVALNTTKVAQEKRLRDLSAEAKAKGDPDPVRFRRLGGAATEGSFTREALKAINAAPGPQAGGFRDYFAEVGPAIDDATKKLKLYNDELSQLESVRDGAKSEGDKSGERDAKQRIIDLKLRTPDKFFEGLAEEKALKKADAEEAARLKKRNEQVAQQGNALAKLRDTAQGSFRVVSDIGTSLAGEDNPYVKVLADQITAAERMTQQWGHLGQAAVDYFTKLEKGAANRQLTKLEFNTFEGASNSILKAGRERDQRDGPGLSRKDQDYLDIQSAIVNRALEIPKLWARTAEILGKTVNPIALLKNEITSLQVASGIGARVQPNLANVPITFGGTLDAKGNRIGGTTVGPFGGQGGRIEGFSAGQQTSTFNGVSFTLDAGKQDDYAKYEAQQREFLSQSPEVQRRTKESFADAGLGILDQFSPQQIRQAGLAGTYRDFTNIKAQGLGNQIEEARKKALLGAKEDARLQIQLKDDADFRQREINAGRDPKEVGRQSDALLLKRTDGINPKDLTADQFGARQEALRRDSERQLKDQEDAKEAVAAGLAFQEQMVAEIKSLRQAILNGDLKVLIQVQNDTQARADQEALQQNQGEGGYQVPLDQKRSATAPSTQRFGRYGRKQ